MLQLLSAGNSYQQETLPLKGRSVLSSINQAFPQNGHVLWKYIWKSQIEICSNWKSQKMMILQG
jgi:hypothetical protein